MVMHSLMYIVIYIFTGIHAKVGWCEILYDTLLAYIYIYIFSS